MKPIPVLAAVNRLILWFAAWVRHRAAAPVPLPAPHPAPPPLPAPPPPVLFTRRRRPPAEARPTTARWEFRRDILDRLDVYFRALRRLKRWDRDGYNLFSRVGLAVPAAFGWRPDVQELPSFGGMVVAPGLFEDKLGRLDRIGAAFIYFQAVNRSRWIERGAHRFRVTIVWDTMQSFGCAASFCVAVESGEARVLKEAVRVPHIVRPTRGRKRHHGDEFTRYTIAWKVPSWLSGIFEELQVEASHDCDTPEAWAIEMFWRAVSTAVDASDRIIVRVGDGQGHKAAVGIDLQRAGYFFKDREKLTALAKDGRRKRIFHSVRQHTRVLATGRETDVHAHYRGIRHFDWQGYRVQIVLPNLNGLIGRSSGLGCDEIGPRPGLLDSTALGRRLDETLAS